MKSLSRVFVMCVVSSFIILKLNVINIFSIFSAEQAILIFMTNIKVGGEEETPFLAHSCM